MAKQSDAISLVEIAAEIPGRIHQVLEPHVSSTPDNVALIEEGTSWTYRELDRSITDIAAALKSLGIRAGDRMIIVSENCIALAALLLAASRIDAWAIVANPRLSPRELDLIRDHLNPELDIKGVVLTMFDGRTKLSADVASEVRRHLGDHVFKTVIPRNVRLSEAPSHGQPISRYAPDSTGALAYAALATELRARETRIDTDRSASAEAMMTS